MYLKKSLIKDEKWECARIHMMRQSLPAVPEKDRKVVTAALKGIYHTASEEAAHAVLEEFAVKWDPKYPSISRKWSSHWGELIRPN
jgi:transposase-like protein